MGNRLAPATSSHGRGVQVFCTKTHPDRRGTPRSIFACGLGAVPGMA